MWVGEKNDKDDIATMSVIIQHQTDQKPFKLLLAIETIHNYLLLLNMESK